MNMRTRLIGVATVSVFLLQLCTAEQCGRQAANALCPHNLCCSQFGWCGSTSAQCENGCQNGPCTSKPRDSESVWWNGQVSFYTEFFPSACFAHDPNQFPDNLFFAAGGDGAPNVWNGGNNCGKWFKIKCVGHGCTTSRTISVKIVDRCPNGCVGGRAFDLSEAAFRALAHQDTGVLSVEYSGPFDNP